jgi:hypothetical protein
MSKISDGKLIARSINNQLYSAIKRNIGADHIVDKIKRFFEGAGNSIETNPGGPRQD